MVRKLLTIVFLVATLSLIGCKADNDPKALMDHLDRAYNKLNPRRFDKFMEHWSPNVVGESEGFRNYTEIFNFYRQYALSGDVLGIDIEFYHAEWDGEYLKADFKETIQIIRDNQRQPLERVLRVWVAPNNRNFQVHRVRIMAIPEGAGSPMFQ